MSYDVGVIGAGILGLAHAEQLARRGLKVQVFERHPRAMGASIRNFGMIWPIGQPLGTMYDLARHSRDMWQQILQESRIWHETCGSLHLAYHADEEQVLREFVDLAHAAHLPCELWTAKQVLQRFTIVNPHQLRAALWSPTEIVVDPRATIAQMPERLASRYGVDFQFDTTARAYEEGILHTDRGRFPLPKLVVCTGADYRELAPEAFDSSGLVPCKLQMMRSQPMGHSLRAGTMLAAGLTLRHYKSFAACPTQGALIQRLDAEYPEYVRYGIHVMLSQNQAGEMVIGDSHEYGAEISPFDKSHIDDLILSYLGGMVSIPGMQIAERWHGIYIKHPKEPFLVAEPRPNMLAVTAVGGAGMTLSFGLAEQTIASWLGESR